MPETIALREYAVGDYPAVAKLWREVFGALKPEDEPQALTRTAADNPGLFLVAQVGGEIAGTVIGTTDSRRGFLHHVAVHPRWRRRGIARSLLAEVEQRLWATGVLTIHLRVESSNATAIEFYHRLGYTTDPPVIGMRRIRPSDPPAASPASPFSVQSPGAEIGP